MSMGMIGRKLGMSRVFLDDGQSVPVTVVEAKPNRVTQCRTNDIDGYSAVRVTAGERRPGRVNKAAAGHFAKAGVVPGNAETEFRVEEDDLESCKPGSDVTLDQFWEGQLVDVAGTSKGRGFAGSVKRWGFKGGRATHGVSLAHRKPGSIGQCQDPGKVFAGKKMAGHMGNVRKTQQNLEVVRIDKENNLLLIKGAVPGHKGGVVFIQPAVKKGVQERPASEEAAAEQGA
ncbi:MAG: 50S ribosomal protein L3 [Gammaproteobacteria bacterium]|nr:MAG: 50S ribosomal protein L3 [Gammaproteobacteria bacterium]RTZ61383.1 MAG: 50S ribosomal protein L3 [Gammaproteobacteria bacterium]